MTIAKLGHQLRDCLRRCAVFARLARRWRAPVADTVSARRANRSRCCRTKRDFWRRKIGVVKGLREDHVIVAILHGDRAGVVGIDGEFPDLKRLLRHAYYRGVGSELDFVEKPVGAAFVGDVLRAVCEKDVSGTQRVTIPACSTRATPRESERDRRSGEFG